MWELLNTFGQMIKDARQAANLTQEELTEQTEKNAHHFGQ